MSGQRGLTRGSRRWGALALLALASWLAWRAWPAGGAPEVRVASVASGTLDAWVTTNGKAEPVSPRVITSKLSTFIRKVAVVEGQAVHGGDLLLTLDGTTARAELARVRAELLEANDRLRAAREGRPSERAQIESDLRQNEIESARLRRERESLERLLARQAATRDELDQNRAAQARVDEQRKLLDEKRIDLEERSRRETDRAALAVQQAQQAAAALEDQVGSADVRAPIDGTVYSLSARSGAFVKPGDVLAELADLRQMRVRAFVDEPELGSIAPDQLVEVTADAVPARLWKGRSNRMPAQIVTRGTRNVGEVLYVIDTRDQSLLPNMTVDVRIRVATSPRALLVPRAAVSGEASQRYVWVVQGDRLRRRPVTLGTASATEYAVLQGLAEGERVALPGAVELYSGMRIRPVMQP